MFFSFMELKSLDTKVPSKIATSEQICSMNPSCILKIIFDDTKSHLSLCSCINLANLEVSDRKPQSAKFRQRIVNQMIIRRNDRWLIDKLNWNMKLKWLLFFVWVWNINNNTIDYITYISVKFFKICSKTFKISLQQRDKFLLSFRYKKVAEIDTSAN